MEHERIRARITAWPKSSPDQHSLEFRSDPGGDLAERQVNAVTRLHLYVGDYPQPIAQIAVAYAHLPCRLGALTAGPETSRAWHSPGELRGLGPDPQRALPAPAVTVSLVTK